MTNPLPPDELWAKVPPDARAAEAVVFLAVEERGFELETRARDLEARLGLNPDNLSRPPSSEPIEMKERPQVPSSGMKPGGWPGPRTNDGPLASPETFDRESADCRRRGRGYSADPTR